ncbi:MAG: TIGR02996 domain-containing protein, partial [Gemmataceae bacterium]|nr:TIGR02996 domain-containing protein [Gemmataceae bacterium]
MSDVMPRAFLNEIVANIDEDTPRLVYADWLQEQGRDERAEFIRVQVERARLPAWDVAQVRLAIREAQLLKRHGEEWLAEIPAPAGARWEGFRRGIVAEVSFATFETFRERAQQCRNVVPVEAVTVRWPRKREGTKAVPPIAELRELALTGRPADVNEIAWLADSPQLATLRALTARGLWLEGLQRLVASPHLGSLRSFRLPSNNLGNAGVVAITRAASVTGLEELTLTSQAYERYGEDPTVQASGVQALVNWAGLANVRRLTMTGSNIGREGLRTLVRAPAAAGLKELGLRSAGLDGQALGELDSAVKGLQLEALDLGENLLKDLGAEYVALAGCLGSLQELRLDR